MTLLLEVSLFRADKFIKFHEFHDILSDLMAGNISPISTYDYYWKNLHFMVFFLFIISLPVNYIYPYFILFHTHSR